MSDVAQTYRKRSSTRVSFEALLRELVAKLRESAVDGSAALGEEGEKLVQRVADWATKAPSEAERHQAINDITDFNQRALDLLRQE